MAGRRADFTFKPNRAAVRKLAKTREMQQVAADRAEQVAAAARAIAPVATGAYRDGIRAVVVRSRDGFIGRVVATHFTSAWIEFGTIHTSARAPLRRALESVFGNQNGENRP